MVMDKVFLFSKIPLQVGLCFLLIFSLYVLMESSFFPVSYTANRMFDTPKLSTFTTSTSSLPSLLSIPSIGILAAVQTVGLVEGNSREMATPSNFTDVAWYKDSAVPGASGSAVLTGHLNGKNVPRAVFYNLDKLVPGDNLYITDREGITLKFVVVKVKNFAYNDPTDEVFLSNNTTAKLNLITCGGSWLPEISRYDTRTVIFSELVR